MQHDNFDSLHRHGFIRAAAATPLVATADPARNAAATIDLMRESDRQGMDLIVFPELGLSSYAIDDLVLQDALLIAVVDAIQIVTAASTDLLAAS
jgi:NAD+ synthase (glutamine-hydrolysing)